MEKNGNRNGHWDCIGVYDRDLKRCQYYVELHYVPHTNICILGIFDHPYSSFYIAWPKATPKGVLCGLSIHCNGKP